MREIETKYLGAPHTVRAYGGHIRQLAKHLQRCGVAVVDATAADIEGYFAGIPRRHLSRHTIGRQIS
ncbi:MAG TPA: site-specific integrase, partial [Planctomycetota bacterium]|nr:site-specific integrase [Planctomycetota bacterium]